jgi:hypothetical protein
MHQLRWYGSFLLKCEKGGGNTRPRSASRVLLVGRRPRPPRRTRWQRLVIDAARLTLATDGIGVESSPNNWSHMPSSRPHPAHKSHDPYAWSRALGLGGAGGRMLMWSIAYIRGCTRERTCDMASPPLNQGRLSRQHLLCSKGPRAPMGRLRFDCMRAHCAREPRKRAAGVLTQSWIETLKLSVSVFHHWALTTRRARLTRT